MAKAYKYQQYIVTVDFGKCDRVFWKCSGICRDYPKKVGKNQKRFDNSSRQSLTHILRRSRRGCSAVFADSPNPISFMTS